jgi:autotransporter-associated beta strand protein
MNNTLLFRILPLAVWLVAFPVGQGYAGSATWKTNPGSNDWSIADNWSPMTVPNGPSDVATFATSNLTSPVLAAVDQVSSIVFPAGASSYTITDVFGTLTISGAGVLNNSGATQNFVVQPVHQLGNDVVISFINQATAGDATYYNYGTAFEAVPTGATEFNDNATAANATFVNYAGTVNSGHTTFRDASTAANAALFNYPSELFDGPFDHGYTQFYGTASADQATFTCYGATRPGVFGIAYGGAVSFSDNATAADSIFTLEGGTGTQTGGGQLTFSVNSTAANATITLGAGANGGLDAYLYFLEDSLGGEARIILSGTLDISGHNPPGVTTGSIEGSGTIILGRNKLTVGSTQQSTTFSGEITDGNGASGSFSVSGGQLTLTNDNIYTGGTSVNGGTLLVDNRSGSATGSGPIAVDSGILAGKGIMSGSVTVGRGGRPVSFLSPGGKTKQSIGTLTSLSSITFNSNGAYRCEVKKGTADKLVANGVTIKPGAQFFLGLLQHLAPRTGTMLTVVDNTSVAPISGTFANLGDGSILVVEGTNFQASYTGGDGNDLTLTVVP